MENEKQILSELANIKTMLTEQNTLKKEVLNFTEAAKYNEYDIKLLVSSKNICKKLGTICLNNTHSSIYDFCLSLFLHLEYYKLRRKV